MHGMNTIEPPAVAIEGVSHSYGARQALDDVNVSIAPSTFAVLLGLNGAGKSTLFSLMTRLYAVQRGHIRIFGHDVETAASEALRMVGVVFQPRTLDLDLSVVQNLTYHAALHGIGNREGRKRANDVLERIALAERAKDKVRSLSGGQMRRLEIARALAAPPAPARARRADSGSRHQVTGRHHRSCAPPRRRGGSFGPVGDASHR